MEAGNPHPTIYIQNLNEKVNLEHVKEQIQEWFSPFGNILNIVIKSRLACRGQAWIQYDTTESARKAIDGMQGKRLYGKTMVIKFAKFKSDSVSKADGTFEVEKYHRDQDKRTSISSLTVFHLIIIVKSRKSQKPENDSPSNHATTDGESCTELNGQRHGTWSSWNPNGCG